VIRALAPGTALALCLLPIAAAAQTSGAAPPDLMASQASQGPMVVERVHSGFLVAPDFKFTEVDKKSSGLAGGYAGFVFDDHFFVGGGAYVLASQTRDREMAYGGLVLQWFEGGNNTFGFSAKTLLGGGRTESSNTVQLVDRGRLVSQRFRTSQDFFVAEPEVDALVRFTKHLRLAVGAGYRFTGSGRRGADGFIDGLDRSGLNGAVGSVGLQIGGGS
jgi:hypothetical protein